MTDVLREKVAAFRTAVAVVKSMRTRDIISDDFYEEMIASLAEYYGLSLLSIFL